MFYHLLLRDIVEIVFYSSCIFILCQWLRTDKTKNLLIYFFAYCILTLCAWIIQLPTLTPFLFTYAPIAVLLFIVLHEKTLQRNLVSLRSITPTQPYHEDWLDIILSSSLTLINNHKSITVIIEHKDALDYFLTAPFFINADIEKNVLDIFLLNPLYDEQKMIWISTAGKLKSINTVWKLPKEKMESDALIFSAHPISRTFTLIIQGKETKNLSAHHVHTMIKKQLLLQSSSLSKGAHRGKNQSEKTISH